MRSARERASGTDRGEPVEPGDDQSVPGVHGGERLVQAGPAGIGPGESFIDVDAVAETPYPARAARWISVSWATVEHRAYPMSATGRTRGAAVAAASVSVTPPSYGGGPLN